MISPPKPRIEDAGSLPKLWPKFAEAVHQVHRDCNTQQHHKHPRTRLVLVNLPLYVLAHHLMTGAPGCPHLPRMKYGG